MPVTGLRTTNLKVQVRNFGSFEELQFLDKYMLNWQSLQSAEICFNALFIVFNYDPQIVLRGEWIGTAYSAVGHRWRTGRGSLWDKLSPNKCHLACICVSKTKELKIGWFCCSLIISLSSCLDVTSQEDERSGGTRCTRWRNILEILHSTHFLTFEP